MKLAFLGAWLVVSSAFAADAALQGTYNAPAYKNDRANEMAGAGAVKTADGVTVWEGSLKTNWKGKIETFTGTITTAKADVKGDFYMMNGTRKGRHFTFAGTSDGGTIKAKIVELVKDKQVPSGDLTLKPAAAK